MTEWIIALGTLLALFVASTCILASRIINMRDDMDCMAEHNKELKAAVKQLRYENSNLRNRVYINPDNNRITSLKLALHLKQEKIDSLQARIDKQNMLLKQKWEGSRCL